jgi:hypothetical protein
MNMTDDELCIHIEDIIRKHTNRHDDTPLDAAQKIVLGLKQVGLLVPDGYVAVPDKADWSMVLAGRNAVTDGHDLEDSICDVSTDDIDLAYRAMLAARPKVGENT